MSETAYTEESRATSRDVTIAKRGLITPRQRRLWGEYLTGYLMIAPAFTLIFLFGIFPVAFALYVSLHKWRLVRSDFRGILNYYEALDKFIYTVLFLMAIGCLVGAFIYLRRIYRQANESGSRPWLLAIPSLVYATTIAFGIRWAYLLLPEGLDIADKIRGLEKTRELFVGLLGEAFRAESVFPAFQRFGALVIASLVLALLFNYFLKSSRKAAYQVYFTSFWLLAAVGVALLRVTFNEVAAAYEAARETGADPGIWPQLIMISSGFLLLIVGWLIWRTIEKAESNKSMVLRALAAIALMVGAVMLIIEIPTILASGDEDLWQGLKVTVFFSVGTVPVQLAIALFLAVLLYQKMAGSSLFRMIFFLPYVTPVIASAAVFKQMFSNRATSPANALLHALGLDAQFWLREPHGVFTLIANGLGFDIPSWAAGPSLALVVIIMLSIWTYVGYNVVIYLAGLVNIPQELNEAAEIDGAGGWQVFRHVTFPLLSPTTYFLSLIAVIGTFKAFNTIWVMRDGAALGTTDPFSVVIFAEFFEKTRYGYASAMAFILFVIIISLTLINNRVQGARVFYG
jgi:multiple sugar transport system permease protein